MNIFKDKKTEEYRYRYFDQSGIDHIGSSWIDQIFPILKNNFRMSEDMIRGRNIQTYSFYI